MDNVSFETNKIENEEVIKLCKDIKKKNIYYLISFGIVSLILLSVCLIVHFKNLYEIAGPIEIWICIAIFSLLGGISAIYSYLGMILKIRKDIKECEVVKAKIKKVKEYDNIGGYNGKQSFYKAGIRIVYYDNNNKTKILDVYFGYKKDMENKSKSRIKTENLELLYLKNSKILVAKIGVEKGVKLY